MHLLEIGDLHKSFGDKVVLAGLSFSIASGEIYGLLGANGSGKTTTISIISRMIAADAGTVSFGGSAPHESAEPRLGIVPQEIALYRHLTCRETLEFFASLHGFRSNQRRSLAEQCLREMALEQQAESLALELSGGMLRRMNIAVGLVHHPTLLVLDEPTAGLDLDSRNRLWELIRGLSSRGTSILLTTHYLEEAETLCSRIGILKDGRLAAEGSMAELRALIPAEEVALIQGGDSELICERAAHHGLVFRRSVDAVSVWLPDRMRMEDVANYFSGLSIRSILLRPVRLEDVYAEVTRAA